ncbi:hypothetical protein KR222_002623 [Zaprionus bogoriensis]|nr:hypothetical protein KR222_002623 [Zaprionus bogoriensis]
MAKFAVVFLFVALFAVCFAEEAKDANPLAAWQEGFDKIKNNFLETLEKSGIKGSLEEISKNAQAIGKQLQEGVEQEVKKSGNANITEALSKAFAEGSQKLAQLGEVIQKEAQEGLEKLKKNA